jgi:hypothetical protein
MGGNRRITCAVRDVSKTGAGLDVAGDVDLPNVFKMVKEMETAQRRCRMIWLNENRMGVVSKVSWAVDLRLDFRNSLKRFRCSEMRLRFF